MKFKLVEYPYGKEIGFNQDVVWFIQGTCDNRKWDNYIWSYKDCCPSIILENEKLFTLFAVFIMYSILMLINILRKSYW